MERKNANRSPALGSKIRDLLPSRLEEANEIDRRRAHFRAALQFEAFVVALLQGVTTKSTESEPKDIVVSRRGVFDFISPVAILELRAPIAFEIKFIREVNSREIVRNLLQSLEVVGLGARTIVLITNIDPGMGDREQIKRLGKEHGSALEFEWWGPDVLQTLVEQLGEDGASLVEALPVAGLGAALRSASRGVVRNWKEEQDKLIAGLRQAWKGDDLVFFLGAGISIDAGVPSWIDLVAQLYGKLIDKIAPDVMKGATPAGRQSGLETLLRLQNNSPLMNARTLRRGLKNEFNGMLQHTLYKSASWKKSDQINELASLCDPPRGRVGVQAVITYNFDDLLEQSLSALKVNHVSIYSDNARATAQSLPIYHVHGFIPHSVEIPTGQTLIFSEEGYHSAYNNPYTWSNIVQIGHLTQHTCVFVGISMTDPNLRRLLEVSSSAEESSPRHVAFMRRADLSGEGVESPQVGEAVLAIHHEAWETTLKEFGVQILWFNEFSEIPGFLGKIRME